MTLSGPGAELTFYSLSFFFRRLLAVHLLLLLGSCVFGRELTCRYGRDSGYSLWPSFDQCQIRLVDLSKRYKTLEYSFTGTSAEKSATTVVWFQSPSQIDFIPKEMLNDFPRLNGLRIQDCQTLTIFRDNFFSEDFGVIQYLNLYGNQIETVEANAFQHLPKLNWIGLHYNQLSSLPHQLFKNNPDLILIWLDQNKINSMTPDFFKNLSKLQHVDFGDCPCIDQVFGCRSGSCLVSQEELDSAFSTCFDNCVNNVDYASKSGKLDYLSSKQIEENLNLIVTSGHTTKLMEKGYLNLLIEKEPKDRIETDRKLENVQEGIGNFKNESSQSDANLLQAISKNSDEIKKAVKKIEDVSQDLKTLKQEIVELKAKLEETNENLEQKISEILQKKFDEFTRKLMEENRP
jgi:hypothetical protein